jgi:hypothetical protein
VAGVLNLYLELVEYVYTQSIFLSLARLWSSRGHSKALCRGFVNRSAIGVGIWRFVEGGEHGRAIRDSGSPSLPSFRSRNGGETLCAAIIHYMATSARLQ